ncbi:unnamed protein product, partial [Ectocarpus sp. 4 AP-2014]
MADATPPTVFSPHLFMQSTGLHTRTPSPNHSEGGCIWRGKNKQMVRLKKKTARKGNQIEFGERFPRITSMWMNAHHRATFKSPQNQPANRARMHLHETPDPLKQVRFWFASDVCILRIPEGGTATGQNKLPKRNVEALQEQAATSPSTNTQRQSSMVTTMTTRRGVMHKKG